MAVQLDVAAFHSRIGNLTRYWKETPDAFSGADCILVPVGTAGEDAATYQKSTSIQSWLFGYEFPDTLMLFTTTTLYAMCSGKKASILEQLNSQSSRKIEVKTFVRAKEDTEGVAIKAFLEQVGQHKKIGIFPKDKFAGKLLAEWQKHYSTVKDKVEEVDVSAAVGTVLAVKDDEEMKIMKNACKMSSIVMQKYFVDQMATIIDEEKVISHEKFASRVENAVFDEKTRGKLNFPSDVNFDMLDWCYTPIIQSGGEFDLKPSAVSNANNLEAGVIISSLGLRYRTYCSNVSRTYLIDPTKDQEACYNFLVELQDAVVEQMKEGVTCRQLYIFAQNYVKEKRPDLETNFIRNIGFVTGIEFRDGTYVIGGKCNRELLNNMTVSLSLGFQNVPVKESGAEGKTYAALLVDTVVVGEVGGTLLTDANKKFGDISFFFKSDSDNEIEVGDDSTPAAKALPLPPRAAKSAVLKTKLRNENRDEQESQEQKRRQHQSTLLQQRVQEGMDRFSAGGGAVSKTPRALFRRFESYKKETMLPREIKNNKIIVDKRADSIILPIFGMAVPFHATTLKNVSKSEEGEFVYLRLNFNTPAQITAKKDQEVLPYEDASAQFIRSFTFRSTDTVRYTELYREITEMKRDITKKEAHRREIADLVEQERLVEAKRPAAILAEVTVRPSMEGKKLPGDLQIHTNGFRYSPIRGDQRIDVLFNNIKHLFFQPCDNELYVILHCHLHHPIIVGKKKTKDIQFLREASEAAFDETSNSRRRRYQHGDEDELMAEQEERRRRQKLNREFKLFAEKVYEVSGFLEADVPIRELGFTGVPSRSNVLLQPTTECLVHLTDPPFLVLTLAEVELAYLERVQFHLKNFDIVFVMKDFSRAPIQINSIPMGQLENIKEWLDSVDILFIEGPYNLNWGAIMKNVNEDPAGFYEDGGWANLMGDAQGEGDESEEESASEYEESAGEEESSDDDTESSAAESDESDASGEEEEGGDEEDEEEGEDWEELERKARRADEKKASRAVGKRQDGDVASDDDDLRPRKKKR